MPISQKSKPASQENIHKSKTEIVSKTIDGFQDRVEDGSDDPLHLLIHAATFTEGGAGNVLPSIRDVIPPVQNRMSLWAVTQNGLPPPFPVSSLPVRQSLPAAELYHPEARSTIICPPGKSLLPSFSTTPITTSVPLRHPLPQQAQAQIYPDSSSGAADGISIFACSHPGCTKQFPSRSRLKRHVAVHQGLKPFKCIHQGCERSFSRRDNMMQHYRAHTETSPKRNSASPKPKPSLKLALAQKMNDIPRSEQSDSSNSNK